MRNRYLIPLALTCILSSQPLIALADAPVASNDSIAFKFTPSYYFSSNGNNATDLNFRASRDGHTAWLGEYIDKSGYQQTRLGYEYKFNGDILRPTLSAQLASGGFVGGSLTSEVGGEYYAILGLGRTNLKDYYNLNFDPNDAITFGVGTRAFNNTELSLQQVRDDRLGTEQQITHLVWRYKPTATERISIDGAYKSGFGSNNNNVHGCSLSLDYDYHQYFSKIAYDQYANFTSAKLTRFSLGVRF
ncbi:MAG: hypothetical protein NTW57_05080 [Methylophilales bacterium]|nr:hypothetical protein [Methylophilales bacterium]